VSIFRIGKSLEPEGIRREPIKLRHPETMSRDL